MKRYMELKFRPLFNGRSTFFRIEAAIGGLSSSIRYLSTVSVPPSSVRIMMEEKSGQRFREFYTH